MSGDIPEQPNLVFVLSDQHSFRCTGYAGHEFVETPNMDRIAEQGVVFENTYCNNPACVPSRASLMTGMYASDVDSFCNATPWDGSQPTWGTRLREAGYHTWATGKLDLDPAYELGFETVDTHHGHAPRDFTRSTNPDLTALFRRPVAPRGQHVGHRRGVDARTRPDRDADTARQADNTEAFLTEKAPDIDEPWAAYFGISMASSTQEAWEPYYERYYPTKTDTPNLPEEHLDDQHPVEQDRRHFSGTVKPLPDDQLRRMRAAYYGQITEIDDYVGRTWDALKASGELNNTIFVYTSDHGEMLGEHGMWRKGTLYEDATHVPLVIAGSGIPEGKRVETPVSLVDLVWTLMEWGEADIADLRGHSLEPLIDGRDSGSDPDSHPGWALCECHTQGYRTGGFSVRKGPWKYVHYAFHDDCLYNVAEDPYELENRIDDPAVASTVEELRGILESELDPEAVTRRGFRAQEELLEEMVDELEKAEIAEHLATRYDDGLARTLAAKYSS